MAIGPMAFEGSILLMIAILFGLVAAVITYINSRKLKGEVFEMPMVYFSLGILLSTISLIVVTFLGGLGDMTVKLVHDLSFIAGLALMLTASVKITKYLRNLEGFESKLPAKKIIPQKV